MAEMMKDEGIPMVALLLRIRAGHGALCERSADYLEGLRKLIPGEWTDASENKRRRLADASGCLDRLESFLLQVSRVAPHLDRLLDEQMGGAARFSLMLPNPLLAPMALQAADICTDFESLLLHARASLDRLTLFVTRQHGQETDRFGRLRNVLGNFERDGRAQRTLALLDEVGSFAGILTDADGVRSLRSRVAHRTSIVEGTRSVFTLYGLGEGRALVFDCEALGFPVVTTSHSLARNIPYLVMNAVAIYLGADRLSLTDVEPNWDNPTVVFSDYIAEQPTGLKLSVMKMLPSGFAVDTQHVRQEVLERAVRIEPPPGIAGQNDPAAGS